MLSGRVAYISISLWLVLAASTTHAQSWPPNPGSFLEPNRFAVVSEIGDSFLWLEAGFGRDINSGSVKFGLEGLIWSRLRQLSGFRFPVETADYFFGPYVTFDLFGRPHRFRLSHISSHLVDGADTVVGGSSSRFSREFVSMERLFYFPRLDLSASVGLRYVFHQVTKVETPLQVPFTVSLQLWGWGKPTQNETSAGKLLATISGDAGPSWPSFSAGLTSRFAFNRSSILELFARYYHGLSRAGIEGKREERQVEIGLQLLPFGEFN